MKKNIILLFGGRSTEHEVSVVSAGAIYRALDRNKYNVIPLGITKEGVWLRGPEVQNALENRQPLSVEGREALLIPHPGSRELAELHPKSNGVELQTGETIDVIFPVLHGKYGEDGTLQGLLEMANVPYVGCGVLGSALGLDKIKQKELLAYHGVPTPPFFALQKFAWQKSREASLDATENALGRKYPLFVKPNNTGSSVGVSKVKSRRELAAAIDVACEYDNAIIVEVGIENIREIEVAVLGNYEPQASACGEIVPGNEFYDYNAKYENEQSQAIIPAPLPTAISEQVRALAVRSFSLLGLRGLARADFFVTKNEPFSIYFNEVNTLPGFTPISMYPKLWEHAGVSYEQLVDKLVNLAIEEWEQKQDLKTSR